MGGLKEGIIVEDRAPPLGGLGAKAGMEGQGCEAVNSSLPLSRLPAAACPPGGHGHRPRV